MDLVRYLFLPLFLITCGMSVIRWMAPAHATASKITESLSKWLSAWALIGFTVPIFLGALAWIMNTDEVMNDTKLIWPFSIGLMALSGKPSLPAVVLVFLISALQNALVYAILAALTWLIFKVTTDPRKRRMQ